MSQDLIQPHRHNNQRHLLQMQFFLEDQNQQMNKTKLVSQLIQKIIVPYTKLEIIVYYTVCLQGVNVQTTEQYSH